MGTNVLVLEPNVYGHHGPYLNWIVEGLIERGLHATVITGEGSYNHPSISSIRQLQGHIGYGGVEILTRSISVTRKSRSRSLEHIHRELAYWKMFRHWYCSVSQSAQVDVVLVPYLDYCLNAIGLLGSPFGVTPWVGIAMRPSFHYQSMDVLAPKPKLSWAKRQLFFRLFRGRHMKHLLTIDESLFEFLMRRGEARNVVSLLPHPVAIAGRAEPISVKSHSLSGGERRVILVYGALSHRKGVRELLEALASDNFPSCVDVLMAGDADPSVRQLLSTTWVSELVGSGRLTVVDRFIDEMEERKLFAEADFIWIGYRNHFTASGVLSFAAAYGVPVIATEEGLIGWQAKRYDLGPVIDPRNKDDIVAAVNSLLKPDNVAQQIGAVDLSRLTTTFTEAQDTVAEALL